MNWNGSSHGKCLHPYQDRLLSEREAARAMGFPGELGRTSSLATHSDFLSYSQTRTLLRPRAPSFHPLPCIDSSGTRESLVMLVDAARRCPHS